MKYLAAKQRTCQNMQGLRHFRCVTNKIVFTSHVYYARSDDHMVYYVVTVSIVIDDSSRTALELYCEQPLFCSKIRGGRTQIN